MLTLVISAALIAIARGTPFPLVESLPESAFSTNSQYAHPYCLVKNLRRTSGHGWCALSADNDNPATYVEVDLGEEREIVSVSTYHRRDALNQYVQEYKLAYSLDGSTFVDYKDGAVLQGNQQTGANTNDDKVNEANTVLDPPISKARYIRVIATKRGVGHKSMRLEIYGGDPTEIACDAFKIDTFLGTCSDLYQANVDELASIQAEIKDTNDRLDNVIDTINAAWNGLAGSGSSSGGGGTSGSSALQGPLIEEQPRDDVVNDKYQPVPYENYNNYGPDNDMPGVKAFPADFRDGLIILSLALNIIVIGYIAVCATKKSVSNKRYRPYDNVKYNDSTDNENAVMNM